jgi:hypothetical protein
MPMPFLQRIFTYVWGNRQREQQIKRIMEEKKLDELLVDFITSSVPPPSVPRSDILRVVRDEILPKLAATIVRTMR